MLSALLALLLVSPAAARSFDSHPSPRADHHAIHPRAMHTRDDQSDINTIRDRRRQLIPSEVSVPPGKIQDWLGTLDGEGKWPQNEIDLTAGCEGRRANWPAIDHLKRVGVMAAAWAGGRPEYSDLKGDGNVLSAALKALDYWFNHDYTVELCMEAGNSDKCPCGTPGLWNSNWFSNLIAAPKIIEQTCVLVGADKLSDAQKDKCAHFGQRACGAFGRTVGGVGTLTGANLLDVGKICIDSALMTNNKDTIALMYQYIHKEVTVQAKAGVDGIQVDGSFSQHGGLEYGGNYGKDYANAVMAVEISAAGTQFEAKADSKKAFELYWQGTLAKVYRNMQTGTEHYDIPSIGRMITFNTQDNQASANLQTDFSQIQQLGNLWNSQIIKDVAAKLQANSQNANVQGDASTTLFQTNDYFIKHGKNYMSSLKMYSSRTKNTECTNDQNPFGFHLSDGAHYTYIRGDEYEDISANWDWEKIPGTTVDLGATKLACDATSFTGTEKFVGGASHGEFGAAAMRYTNPANQQLHFQKAWVFFPDDVEHVMLSSISSSNQNQVVSVLDQKRLRDAVVVDGQTVSGSQAFTGAKTLYHDGVAYAFEKPAALQVDVGQRSGDWSKIGISTAGTTNVDLFAASVVHGSGSNLAAPFAYSIFPGVSASTFNDKIAGAGVRTSVNDAHFSVAYAAKGNAAALVFWDAEGGETVLMMGYKQAPMTVRASGNAVVLVEFDTGMVTVSDPSQTLSTLAVTFTLSWLGKRPEKWGPNLTKMVQVQLPSGNEAGSSVTRSIY